ncbi:MAG: lipid-A-disaccharide synthase [Terracidiphilus sp.]|jgi:lipid-A-disaccharide synthase
MPTTIFISAGEASGEHYGALLASALSPSIAPKAEAAELIGMGGPRMQAAGVDCIVRAEDMAVMGLTEVVLHLPRISREFRKLKKTIRARRPTVAILIDFPEIHFRLAREFHRLGIPVIYFVSPQLWAWKQHRIRLVREYVRRMLVIFPFEESYYRTRGVDAEFVGHPLADLPLPAISREQFAAENGLDPARTWIGLLPGSRLREIEHHLPEMLAAARALAPPPPDPTRPAPAANPASSSQAYEFLIPLAPTLDAAQRNSVFKLAQACGRDPSVRFVHDARATLLHARASVVASGTATVEAALIGNPFVVVYRVSPLTYAIARRLVKVPHVAMANLIAGKRVVPELIQHDFTAANIVQHLSPLLPDGPARESMRMELGLIREALHAHEANQPGQSAIERVAAIVVKEVESLSQAPAAIAEFAQTAPH